MQTAACFQLKKFEFGSKASILVDQHTDIIMGAINFTQTLYDSKTIPEVLGQYQRLNGKQAKQVFVDGVIQKYKTLHSIIHIPKPNKYY